MTIPANLARPYARAAFEYAVTQKQLPLWSEQLQTLANILQHPAAKQLLKNPQVTASQQAEILISLLTEKNKIEPAIKNFINLLALNKRLIVLPEIARLFAELKAESEKVVNVQVSSAIELEDSVRKKLTEMLHQKIGRSIKLECDVNPDLMGGLLVRAGDLVIDASVRGQLDRMRADLIN